MQTTEINVTLLCWAEVQRAPNHRCACVWQHLRLMDRPGCRANFLTFHILLRVIQFPLPLKDSPMASGSFQWGGATLGKVVAVWSPAQDQLAHPGLSPLSGSPASASEWEFFFKHKREANFSLRSTETHNPCALWWLSPGILVISCELVCTAYLCSLQEDHGGGSGAATWTGAGGGGAGQAALGPQWASR